MQKPAVNQILFPLSLCQTKCQCKSMIENEGLKMRSSSEKPRGSSRRKLFFCKISIQPKKHMILHAFPPTANCIRYIKVAQVQVYFIYLAENAPHFTKMNVHKLLVYAKCDFHHRCFAPSCTLSKGRCSI